MCVGRAAVRVALGLVLGAAGVDLGAAQSLPPPEPSGRQIQAAHGDTIVVEGDDRVTVVRRRQARVRVVAGETSQFPRVIHRVQPEWPQAARDAGVRGVVILVVDVALDGTVRDARLVRSIPGLDDAAVGAVRQWRFEPAEPGSRPDPLAVTVTVQLPAQP